MVKMQGFSWESYGICCFLLRPVLQESQNSSLTKRRKNLRRKWKKRRGYRRFRKHGESETKRRKRRRKETEIGTKIETKIVKKGGAAAETSPHAAPDVTAHVHLVPRMTRRNQRKSHQGGTKRKETNPRRRKRKLMEMHPPRRSLQQGSHRNMIVHPSRRQ